MGRFDGILLCSDIDGTFAVGKEIPQRNLDALRYFESEGGRFTLFTGRQAGYEAELPLNLRCPMVTENGARIYDPQLRRTLWTFPLDGCGALLEWLDACPLLTSEMQCHLCFTDTRFPVPPGTVVDEALAHTQGDLLKIVCTGFRDGGDAVQFLAAARETFGARYTVFRSWDTGVEFISPLGGKGVCLNHLRKLLEDSVHTVIAVGDYENDLSMFSAADRAFAPSDALPEVRAAAERVLCPCTEGAVGELIEILDGEMQNK